MEVKNWEQFAIWLGMQFPVLAAAFLVTRWFLNRADAVFEKHIQQNDALHAKVTKEKDDRLADRDARIVELKAEVGELRKRLSRSGERKKDRDGGTS